MKEMPPQTLTIPPELKDLKLIDRLESADGYEASEFHRLQSEQERRKYMYLSSSHNTKLIRHLVELESVDQFNYFNYDNNAIRKNTTQVKKTGKQQLRAALELKQKASAIINEINGKWDTFVR